MKGHYMTMRSVKMRFLILMFAFLFPGCGGAPQMENENLAFQSKTFEKEYDEVWDALEHIMVDKMRLPIQIKDKERGIIQSDWVSVIRLRGSMRWYVKVLLNKEANGTTVRVSHAAEVPTEVIGDMKDKKGDIKTGWQNAKENIKEAQELMSLLSSTLE
jgi:hypothetical protein